MFQKFRGLAGRLFVSEGSSPFPPKVPVCKAPVCELLTSGRAPQCQKVSPPPPHPNPQTLPGHFGPQEPGKLLYSERWRVCNCNASHPQYSWEFPDAIQNCAGFIRHRPPGPHPRIRLAFPSSGIDLASIQHRFDIDSTSIFLI